ncbi:MAG: hypothetical protein ACRDO7_02625 [Nocardioidaceae bacterium]
MSESKEVFRGVTGHDLAALGLVLAVCSPWIAVVALGRWQDVVEWGSDHGLLVTAGEDPLVTFPWADGAGLDTGRLVIALAAVIALLAVILYLRFRWRAYRRARYEWRGMGRA